MRTFYIKTFGCQMNDHDSERIAEILKARDFAAANEPEKANLILLNTCSIREKSQHKVYSLLGRLKHLKKKNKNLIIGVCGCVAQQEKNRIMERMPHVDLVFGTHQIFKLPKMLDEIAQKNKKVVEADFLKDGFHFVKYNKTYSEFSASKYVTITNGCNNFCSYCIVPYVRGPENSRPINDIITEIKNMAGKGTKEVTLIGQNVNSYGKDFKPKVMFQKLLDNISKINGLERIRFTTSHPKDLSDDLVKCFNKLPKLCEHIHLPVQSGSNRILKAMNRKYMIEDYVRIIEKLRKSCPNIAITTDLIVGFPGETDEDFQKTIDLVKKVRFDNFFSFKYSPRPGTNAAQLADDVPELEKKKRLSYLQKLQEMITEEIDKSYKDKVCEVLVEGYSKNSKEKLTGRTRTNKIVNFYADKSLIGEIVKVKITQIYKHSLGAEVT